MKLWMGQLTVSSLPIDKMLLDLGFKDDTSKGFVEEGSVVRVDEVLLALWRVVKEERQKSGTKKEGGVNEEINLV
jgi:hypothetical protein